jgi:hypothetical protein
MMVGFTYGMWRLTNWSVSLLEVQPVLREV